MPVPSSPSALVNLGQDGTLQQDATYLLTDKDRSYIDGQQLSVQYNLLNALLLGKRCSWFTLDPGSMSASQGDVVCSAGTAGATVTRALTAPMSTAGAALGVTIFGGPPGGKVLVALGGLIPQSVTGLAASVNTAIVNTATARLVPGSIGYPMGFIDSAGNLTLKPGASSTKNAPNFFKYVDFSGSIAGAPICDGPGFNPTTAGVRFLPHLGGSIISGMRFIWAVPGTGAQAVKLSLWTPTSGSATAATVTMPSVGTGIFTATFTTPYTVLAADVDGPCIISTYSYYSGTGGGYFVETDWHGTPLGIANIPIFASPLWSYGDGSSGDHSMGNVFGVTSPLSATSEQLPTLEFGQSRYFAMEPIFQ